MIQGGNLVWKHHPSNRFYTQKTIAYAANYITIYSQDMMSQKNIKVTYGATRMPHVDGHETFRNLLISNWKHEYFWM